MADRKWFLILSIFMTFSLWASTSKPDTKNYPARQKPKTTHKVGECFGGGVIIYINDVANPPAKQQGIIAALTDVPNSFKWDVQPSKKLEVKTHSALFSGSNNTKNILSKIGKNRGQSAAATLSYTDGVYFDWYLPSKDELSQMYWQAIEHGGEAFWKNCKGAAPSGATYWSSSQSSASKAWGLSFAGGVIVTANKSNPLLVRAVRSF